MKKRVVFFGTPYLAKKVLEDCYNSDYFDIVAIVSQPDKPVGRKQEILPTPTKEFAIEKNIECLQPEKLRNNLEFQEKLKSYNTDYFIVVAYGKIIPKEILSIPKIMCINVHGSILPKYRGASPIQASLINGETETGVTIMQMSEGMDEGDILDILKIQIDRFETSETLFDKFAQVSGKFLVETVKRFDKGEIHLIPQDSSKATYCKKIDKEDGKIDFFKSSQEIFNLWKGLTPWPGIFTYFKGKKLIIEECDYELRITNYELSNRVGEVININNEIGTICREGVLILKKVKLEGKKSQDIKEFINGYRDFVGSKLGQ